MKKLLEYETFTNARDIVITIPKAIKWEVYEKELEAAENGETMNFKVRHFPNTKPGSKCYVCHDGFIKGWMKISKLSEKEFDCTTTGKTWKGKFVERTGKFNALDEPIPMKGFRGFKYFDN